MTDSHATARTWGRRVVVLGTAAAAVVAAVALSPWGVWADPGDVDTTYVPIQPCRLLDLRTPEIGDRDTPMGPGEELIQTVVGRQGQCHIPDHATGLSLNVTIANPTADSFLTVYPGGGAPRPLSSNLNWFAGQVPTPNMVNVGIGPQQRRAIRLYNAFGEVDVIVDVLGFYSNDSLSKLSGTVTDISRSVPRLVYGDDSVESSAGVDGVIVVTAQATVELTSAGQDAGACTVEGTGGLIEPVSGEPVGFSDVDGEGAGQRVPLTVSRVFVVENPDEYPGDGADYIRFDFVCTTEAGAFDITGVSTVAEFFPRGASSGF